jgi:mRNA-degrading endonuclease RelE of RelBE toxin-antitoxin system
MAGQDPSKKSSEKPSFEIRLSRDAEKSFTKLKDEDKNLVLDGLRLLTLDPYDKSHVRKLVGEHQGRWRLRKGNWRILYRVDGEFVTVLYIRRRQESTYR